MMELSVNWCTGDLSGTGDKAEVGKEKQDPSKCCPRSISSAKNDTVSLLHNMETGRALVLEVKISVS